MAHRVEPQPSNQISSRSASARTPERQASELPAFLMRQKLTPEPLSHPADQTCFSMLPSCKVATTQYQRVSKMLDEAIDFAVAPHASRFCFLSPHDLSHHPSLILKVTRLNPDKSISSSRSPVYHLKMADKSFPSHKE
mmetsp:Transcript_47033/g.73612  ORF Transcript_47033/g.73612 Transcript_47033/m.73612 type:complete len:138 (+) Transcript_47033:1327-1740(+)